MQGQFTPVRILAAALITAALSGVPVQAQQPHWVQTNGPTGGSAASIVMTDDGQLFTSINSNGVYRSTDGAVTWEQRNNGVTSNRPSRVFLTRSGTLLLASLHGIFRSTDRGEHWSECNTGMNKMETEGFVQLSDGSIFVATFADGVYASTNDGVSWTAAGLSGIKVRFIAATAGDMLVAGTYGKGLFSSTDRGATWTDMRYPSTNPMAFAETPGGLYFASGHLVGVHRSTDQGQTWERSAGLPANLQTECILATPSGEIYSGVAPNETGLYKSTDDGVTWAPFAQGLASGAPYDMLLTASGDLFLAHMSDGIYRRMKNEGKWTRCNNGIKGMTVYVLDKLPGGPMLAGCYNGIFRSENHGIDWVKSDNGLVGSTIRDMKVIDANLVLATVYNFGLEKSTDGGLSWSLVTNGFDSNRPRSIARDAQGRLFVSTAADGVFVSTDGGQNWQAHENGLPGANADKIFITATGSLLLATYDSLYRSDDHGVNWGPSNMGLGKEVVYGFGQSGSDIWAATGYGPYRSVDDGRTWTKVTGLPFSDKGIECFLVEPGGLLTCSTDDGPYQSTDGGAHWTSIVTGVEGFYVNALLRNDRDELLAGTENHGVFRWMASPASSEVTVSTNPEGRRFRVDGVEYASTQTFSWNAGSRHEISTDMTQAGPAGVRYIWTAWSDGGGLSHSITAPTGAQTITAQFRAEYQLAMNADGAGTVTPQTGWYNPGAEVQIRATANAGQTFQNWEGSGTGSYTGTDNPATVRMNGAISQTAHFSGGASTREITLTTAPPGRRITVDGQTYTNPHTFSWPVGSSHEIGTSSPQQGSPGIRYVWNSWSSGEPMTHTWVVPAGAAMTLTAQFDMQYSLTMAAGTGGTVSPGTGWQDAGAQVQLLATPQSGYAFDRWDGTGAGSYSGTDNPALVTITGAVNETASFRQTTGVDDATMPRTITLLPAAPNPCTAFTAFTFDLPRPLPVTLLITDLLGRECARVIDRRDFTDGRHRVTFDVSSLRSGVYTYRLEAGTELRYGRMVVLR